MLVGTTTRLRLLGMRLPPRTQRLLPRTLPARAGGGKGARSPDAAQRVAKRNGAPLIRGPHVRPLDPGSAAHHCVLRCAGGTLAGLRLQAPSSRMMVEFVAREEK